MKFKKLISGLTSAVLSLSAFAGISPSVPKAYAAQGNWKFDFGGNGTASGYTGVSAYDGYNQSKGYGFGQTYSVSNVSAGGSGANSDAVKFNSEDPYNTFNVDLPKGLYQVTVTTGNSPRTTIKLEGMLQMINLTGNNAVETVQIPVTDGQLNVQAVAGMANREYSISALEIKQLNTTGEMKPTIWICGDSTAANYYNVGDSSQHGWGQFLGNYVDTNTYEIRNLAASGQFAKGFVASGQFEPVEYYGKSGDYYIIAMGINDTNKNYTTEQEYIETVTDMVRKAKAKGMNVLLVKQQGRRSDLSRNPLLTGRWFGGDLDNIGSSENVPVIDLFTPWQNFGLSVGFDGMASYYATQADGSADDLHQSKKGAVKLAEIMASLMNTKAKTVLAPEANVSFMLKNANSGLYLEVADSKAEQGANVRQWAASSPSANNTWTFKQATGDYYYIVSNLGGNGKYMLYVDNGSKDNGGNIVIAEKNGYSDQFFKIMDNGDDTVSILTRASRDARAVEVESALTSNGANVQQWEVNNHNCQKWILEKVDFSTETTTTTTVTTTAPTTETTTVTSYRPRRNPGDANCDELINLADVVMIMQFLANPDVYGLGVPGGITEQGLLNADVDGADGWGDGVTGLDALFIQKYCLSMVELPKDEYIEPETTTTTTVTTTQTTTTVKTLYYAIDQQWNAGITETVNAGYSDQRGYLNLDNSSDSYVDFTVNVQSNGNYMTHIRFANGSANDRKMKLYVNGNTQNYWLQSFTSTGAWTEWTEFGIVLPLNAGRNTIRFQSATSEGGPNLDYIDLTLTDEPFAETYDPSQDKQPEVTGNRTLYIAGDSTAQSYRASYAPQQGWGYYMADFFNSNVTVSNQSIAGRSSKKFYDEGRWKTISDNLKQGDFVLIQFAINDAGSANADRYAPTCNNVDNPSANSYEWYMTQFITDAKSKGATPILVTNTLGMKAYSGGRFSGSYTNYCDACKKLASKYSVPCIDLNSIMVNHYNSIGYDAAVKYHLMGAVSGSADGTHFCEYGAKVVAGLVADAIRNQQISGLCENLK